MDDATAESPDWVADLIITADARLADADAALLAQFPGQRAMRQPVHTVYLAADRYRPGLAQQWGTQACSLLASGEQGYRRATGTGEDDLARVQEKLGSEPIEDLRIDFEDGAKHVAAEAEDAVCLAAAKALRLDKSDGTAPPYVGIRFKSLEGPTRARGIRTLAMFLDTAGWVDGMGLTLPKVTSVAQVEAMVELSQSLEDRLGLADHAIGFELQIETPQSILGPDGTALVARMIHVGDGRVTGLHYGTYDYSAFVGVAAAYQSMEHPAADYAKSVMQAAAAGTGVRLSDGSTNILPVGDDAAIERGWELHHRLVRRHLERAYYQGWDLHPHQLPTRFGATFAFFRERLEDALVRLRHYVAGVEGAVLDEPATARALADYVLRGLDCGAVSWREVSEGSGLDLATLNALAKRVDVTSSPER